MSLSLTDASYHTGGTCLLDQVSIDVTPGTVTVIVGPNGAGKSTALKLLAGDIAPTAGCACLDGEPIAAVPPAELARRRAVLPQSSHLNFNFRVCDVVALGRLPFHEAHKSPPLKSAVNNAMRRAGCHTYADRSYLTLSGGERQRVHFARILAQMDHGVDGANRYILLDEPTNALDLVHQLAILDVCRQLADEGAGVMIVLHDFNLALRVADHVVILNNGRVYASGAPAMTLTPDCVEQVWGIPMVFSVDLATQTRWLVPRNPENRRRA